MMNTAHSALNISGIIGAYFTEQPASIEPCGSGIINTTYLVHFGDNQKYVVQQLNALFGEATIADFHAVSVHLSKLGHKVQRLVPTISNNHYYRDADGRLWRVLSYVDGADAPEDMNEVQLASVGEVLGNLHESLRSLAYKPTFTIPNFHDTAFYARTLRRLRTQVVEMEAASMADACLRAYPTVTLPQAPLQLIHGDPRTTNILFDPTTALPSCYIDFDTLMYGSPWIDIGDLLRSISGSNDQTQEKFSARGVEAIMQGYLRARPTSAPSLQAGLRYGLESMRIISLELAMRFLIDTVQDYYFGWDAALFQSRKENNIVRARAQLAIYQKATSHTASAQTINLRLEKI